MADPGKIRVRLPDGRVGMIPSGSLGAAQKAGAQVLQDDQPEKPQQMSAATQSEPGMWDRAVNATGRFLGAMGDAMDPKPVLDAITDGHPIEKIGNLVKAVFKAQGQQGVNALGAALRGDYQESLRQTMGNVPIIGPAAIDAGNDVREGRVAEGLGKAAALGLQAAAPGAMQSKGSIKVPGVLKSSLNPSEAAAIAFADANGIPVDLAMRTGNKWIQNAKTLVQNTIPGASVSKKAQGAQTAALARKGEALADDVHQTNMNPQAAAEAIQAEIERQGQTAQRGAAAAADTVYPSPVSPEQAGEGLQKGLKAKIQFKDATAGQEYDIVRAAEKDPRNTREVPVSTGRDPQAAADLDAFSKSLAGKPFAKLTPTEQSAVLRTAASAGVDVAERPIMESVPMPVDLRNTKAALKPIWDQLTRQMAPAQQRASTGMKAIGNIMEAPDYLPLSVADADLSAIKAAARGADMPEPRTLSQGLAAEAVKHFEDAVSAATAEAGPDILKAREAGRAATREKYDVASVLTDMREEPVQAYGQMVYAKDSGVKFLRSVAEHVPKELPRIGRAKIDQIMGSAAPIRWVEEFDRLGPETQKTLFGDQAKAQALRDALSTASDHAEIVRQIPAEPVTFFRKLTHDGDASATFLAEVAKKTPSEMPKVGRAVLQGLLDDATKSGEFQGGKTLLNNWQRLGPETKRTLFKNPQQIADIDNFFRLAEMQARNPNPSGTAHVLTMSGHATGTAGAMLTNPLTGAAMAVTPYLVAKALYSPKAARMLMKGMEIPLSGKPAATVAFNNILAVMQQLEDEDKKKGK